jgi:hypothetical protein
LFLPFELIWAGGLSGRVAAQVGYWWSRSRDEMKAKKARGREAGGRNADPRQRRLAPAKKRIDRAAPSDVPSNTSSAAAMEVPAVAFPADPDLDPPPTRMAVPPLSADDPSAPRQRTSRIAVNAGRSNR